MRDLCAALVDDIEAARAFGNTRRLAALATSLRVIMQLAAKMPDAQSGIEPVCAACRTPMSIAITDADLQLIEHFIERQKGIVPGATITEQLTPSTDSALAGSFPESEGMTPPPQGGGDTSL